MVLVNAAPCTPAGEVTYSNAGEATAFDSGACKGKYLMLHRPTDDPDRMASGDYAYGEHMHGRKRLWEFRVQLTPTEDIEGDVYFGAEKDRYLPLSLAQIAIAEAVSLLVSNAAQGIHHAAGEDPAAGSGEKERPQFLFPMWLADQLIITPEGDDPPDLTASDFSSFGWKKTDDRAAFRSQLGNLRYEKGYTYTFGIWSVSQFIDAIAWAIRPPTGGLVPKVQLNDFGNEPPLYITFYALKPREQWDKANVRWSRDNRHLDSRKTYLWRVGLWSTYLPPDPTRAYELTTGARAPAAEEAKEAAPDRRQGCCGMWGI